MKTAKRMMMALVVIVMMVMVLPNTSAEAAKTKGKLNKKKIYLAINDGENDKISKETAKYTLKLTGVSKKVVKKAKWSSSNKKVATVNKKGIVTGKKHGKATITCKVGKVKYTCFVSVNDIQKLIKNPSEAPYGARLGTVTVDEEQFNTWAKIAGEPTRTGIIGIGFTYKMNGQYYFFYSNWAKWIKKYAHIKDGRLYAYNPWNSANKDPEYVKQEAEKEAKATDAFWEGIKKSEEEAKAKAKADEKYAQLQAEGVTKDKAEAKVSECNKKVLEALEALGVVNVVYFDDGSVMGMFWNSQEANEAYDEWCSERKKALEEITAVIESKWNEISEVYSAWHTEQDKVKTVEALITSMDSKMDEMRKLYDAWVAEQEKVLEEELAWIEAQGFYDEWEAFQKE